MEVEVGSREGPSDEPGPERSRVQKASPSPRSTEPPVTPPLALQKRACHLVRSWLPEPPGEGPVGTPSLAHARHALLDQWRCSLTPPRTRTLQSNSNFLSFTPRNRGLQLLPAPPDSPHTPPPAPGGCRWLLPRLHPRRHSPQQPPESATEAAAKAPHNLLPRLWAPSPPGPPGAEQMGPTELSRTGCAAPPLPDAAATRMCRLRPECGGCNCRNHHQCEQSRVAVVKAKAQQRLSTRTGHTFNE